MIIFLCKYCIVTLVTLTDLWICFSFCSLEYYQSIIINQEEKIELHKRIIEESVWGISRFWLQALFPMSFLSLFLSTTSFTWKKVVLLRKTVAVGGEGGGTGTPCALQFLRPWILKVIFSKNITANIQYISY